MNKRGQFYLIAAFIIIMGLIALASVRNSILAQKDSEDEKFYEMVDELDFESAKVVDYGIYTGDYGSDLINSWVGNYTAYTQETIGEAEWVFVYGNQTQMKSVKFDLNDEGSITLGGSIGSKFRGRSIYRGYAEVSGSGKKITVNDTEGIEREFNLNPGENFYFVVIKNYRDKKLVETNE